MGQFFQNVMYYISLWDTFFLIGTCYYFVCSVFFFLMWFFKRPLDVIIEERNWHWILHVCYWCGYGLWYIHYGILFQGKNDRGYEMLYIFTVPATVIYIGYMLHPLVSSLRSKIPDTRGQ